MVLWSTKKSMKRGLFFSIQISTDIQGVMVSGLPNYHEQKTSKYDRCISWFWRGSGLQKFQNSVETIHRTSVTFWEKQKVMWKRA